MRSLIVLALCCCVGLASCLTNRDVYEVIQKHGKVMRDYDGDGAIVLPGDLDDDLDIEYLMRQFGLLGPTQRGLTAWQNWKRERTLEMCTCNEVACHCCLSQLIGAFGFYYEIKACLDMEYIQMDDVLALNVQIEGFSLYYQQIPMDRRKKTECFIEENFESVEAELCMRVYDIDRTNHKACMSMYFIVKDMGFVMTVQTELGCINKTETEIAEHGLTGIAEDMLKDLSDDFESLDDEILGVDDDGDYDDDDDDSDGFESLDDEILGVDDDDEEEEEDDDDETLRYKRQRY